MDYNIPEKFERSTRWAYLDSGIEVGPYSATEIVELIEQRKVRPDTTVVELNTRQFSPLQEVAPFARAVVAVLQQARQQRSEAEIARAENELVSGGRMKVVVLSILGAVVVGGGIVALLLFNPFKAKDEAGAEAAAGKAADVPAVAEPGDGAQQKKDDGPTDFAILEHDPLEGEDDRDEQLVESVLEEKTVEVSADKLAEEEKLEGPAELAPERDRGIPRPSVAGGVAAVSDEVKKAMGDNIQTFDFTEDEEEGGPSDDLAKTRLRQVVKRCVENRIGDFGDADEVTFSASARLQPDGRLTGLRIQVKPRRNVGSIKMCASAELMRMRVPAYEGDELPISTSGSIPVAVVLP